MTAPILRRRFEAVQDPLAELKKAIDKIMGQNVTIKEIRVHPKLASQLSASPFVEAYTSEIDASVPATYIDVVPV